MAFTKQSWLHIPTSINLAPDDNVGTIRGEHNLKGYQGSNTLPNPTYITAEILNLIRSEKSDS